MSSLTYWAPPRNLPDDIDYFIDCAVECNDLTTDVAFWMQYFCPNVADLLMFEPMPHHRRDAEDGWINESEGARRALDAYRAWFRKPKTDPVKKLLCTCIGLSHVRHTIGELCQYVTQSAICEENTNSYFPNIEFNAEIRKTTRRVRHFKMKKITAKGGHYPISVYDWQPFFQKGYPQRCIRMLGELSDRWKSLGVTMPDRVAIHYPPRGRYRTVRHYDRDTRRIIRRGLVLLEDLIGSAETKKFISTKQIVIPGEKFSIRYKLDHLQESHGGGTTEVLVDGKPVCNLCIYTPETPVLDHVASMIVHMNAGLEDDILGIGNAYNIVQKEPTGVAVIDDKIGALRARENRHVVVNPIYPEFVEVDRFVRLGDSPFTRDLNNRMKRRIAAHMTRFSFADMALPRPNLKFTHHQDGRPAIERFDQITHLDRLVLAITDETDDICNGIYDYRGSRFNENIRRPERFELENLDL